MDRTNQPLRKVAVIRALQLGDLLCAVPALRALRSALPDSQMTLVGLPWASGFVRRFDRYLDSFLEFPGYPGLPEIPSDDGKLADFEAEARDQPFDLAIQMHGDGSITNRFLRHLHARHVAGFCPPGSAVHDGRFMLYPEELPEILRLLELTEFIGVPPRGEHLEFPVTPEDEAELRSIMERFGLVEKRYICLHPGSRDPDRRWPVASFVELAKELSRQYALVLTGTEGEREITGKLAAGLGGQCRDLTALTTLGGLACLLRSSRLLVCNDTGVSHLAAALDVPSVVIFSGSDPVRWAPLDKQRHRALGDPVNRPGENVTVEQARAAAFSLMGNGLVDLRPVRRSSGLALSRSIQWRHVKRILALRLDNIGDVILLGPALRALKSHVPHAHITLMASPAGSQAARLLPDVDELWTERVIWQDASFSMAQDPARQMELVDRIRKGNFDLALVFSSFSQSPYPPGFLCYLAGVPVRAGDSKEFGGSVLSHWVEAPEDAMHQAERNLNLLRAIGCPAPSENSYLELAIPPGVQHEADGLLAEVGIEPGRRLVAVVPGASCDARTYPFARYLEVVDLLSRQTACPIVLLGSPREAQSLQFGRVGQDPGSSRVASLIGRTTVAQFAAILRSASLVIANNSSAIHVADAFRRPMVILYSGTEFRSQWRPRFSLSRILTRPTACSPCYQFHCPYQLECLDISAEEVCREAISLLELTSSPAAVEPGAWTDEQYPRTVPVGQEGPA